MRVEVIYSHFLFSCVFAKIKRSGVQKYTLKGYFAQISGASILVTSVYWLTFRGEGQKVYLDTENPIQKIQHFKNLSKPILFYSEE